MKHRIARYLLPTLLNSLALALAPAGAQGISPTQESMIQPGMSQARVQALLGLPSHEFHFVKEGVTTLTYELPEQAAGGQVFDIDIDARGRVVHAAELVEVAGRRTGR